MIPLPLPLIPGTDIAGTIEATGEGVSSFKPGDRVYARGGVMRDGTNAEFAVTPASDVAAMPPSLDVADAAALPHVSLTAWQALFELAGLKPEAHCPHPWRPGRGRPCRGAIGQVARREGPRHCFANLDFVRELGADEVIDYSKEPFEKAVRGVDVVLDTVGGDTQERSWGVLKPGGILVSVIQAPSPETAAAQGVRQAFVYSAPPIGETLTKIAELVENNCLRPEVQAVLPLADIRKAHEIVEGRHVQGKIVLQVS